MMSTAGLLPTPAAADAVAPARDESETAYPPRLWWLRRLTLLGVLLVLGLLLLRVAWGWEAERRLARALEPIRARGEPVLAGELNPAVPDDLNGAAYLNGAVAGVDRNAWSPANTAMDYDAPYTPHSTGWHATAAASVAANRGTFQLARKAREFERFDWGLSLNPAGVTAAVPKLNGARMLINTVGDAAMYAHEQGDDVAALEAVRDVRNVAAAMGSQPLLVAALVGVGGEASALSKLQQIAPGLRIAAEGDARAEAANAPAARAGPLPSTNPANPPRPVTPGNVRELIAELLDDRDATRRMMRGYAGERAIFHQVTDELGRRSWLLRPMWKLDAARTVAPYEALIGAASQPNLAAAQAALGAARPIMPPPAAVGINLMWPAPPAPRGVKRQPLDFPRVLSNSFMGGMASSSRAIEQHLRVAAERKMVAVNLAAQLYRTERGRWPATLEDLVPKYLPEMPADPMAPDGQPLRYVLVKGGLPGGDRPVVYSAGPNGVFDTTDPPRLPGVPLYDWTQGADQWRDLSRWAPPPATAPATRPSTP